MSWDFIQTGEFFSVMCALLFAVGVMFFRKSGLQVSPVALNLFKDVVSLGLLLLTLPILGLPLAPAQSSARDWIMLLLSGAVGIGVADSLFFASLNRLGAGRSAIVDCLYSPFVILGSYLFLGSAVGAMLLLSVALMVGAILIGAWQPESREGGSPVDKEQQRRQARLGVIYGVLSMMGMAAGIILAKPVLNVSNPWWATTVRLMGGVALLCVQGLGHQHREEILRVFRPGRLWRVTLPAALIGTYGAMTLWVAGMTYAETTTASVLNQLSIIFVLILATIFLREKLTLRKTIAIIMGFAGGVITVL